MMQEQRIADLAAYIRKWHAHLDRHFGERAIVAGKRVLVVGSGWGTEVLWALRHGAEEVVGLDPYRQAREPLERALDELDLQSLSPRAKLYQTTVADAVDIGTFDVVISNNVIEHIFGLSATFAALARMMPDPGTRFYVFTDPLFFSSHGHHMPVGPWDHLQHSQVELKERVAHWEWSGYRTGLNGMTVTDFLSAVREAGMILTEFSIILDHNASNINELLPLLPPGIKPMDLCLEGISCTLAFPHNL